MSKSQDIIKYYAKKYDFHKLLLSLLASTDAQQKEIISKSPIIQTDLFLTYLQKSTGNERRFRKNPKPSK